MHESMYIAYLFQLKMKVLLSNMRSILLILSEFNYYNNELQTKVASALHVTQQIE